MFFALIIGVMTGFCFTPLALVPVSTVFLATSVAMWSMLDELSIGKLGLAGLYLVLLNASYLLGAVLKRFCAARRQHHTPDE